MLKNQIKLNKYCLYWLGHYAENFLREYRRVKSQPDETSEMRQTAKDFSVYFNDDKYAAYNYAEALLIGYCRARQLCFNYDIDHLVVYDIRTNKEVLRINVQNEFIMTPNVLDYAEDLGIAGL